MSTSVTVIIPTAAESKRFEAIKRAVDSIRNSSKSNVNIIAVVNGSRFDNKVCDWLKNQNDITYHYETLGSAPNAQLVGRKLVKTPYFSFLDDDDLYLPGAIDARLDALKNNPDAALVVTNGLSETESEKVVHYKNLEMVNKDPFSALFVQNWLGSCNNLMRSNLISPAFFENYHPYFEWTWLAFKMMMSELKVVAINESTFIYNNTQESASKSDKYFNSFPELVTRMLSMSPPTHIKKQILSKLSAHYHDISYHYLSKNMFHQSWANHFKSMIYADGIKYITFSRHILFRWLRTSLKLE